MPVAVSKTDHYALLELEKGATEDEIRVAYKKLALKWHPDRHQDHKEEAQEKFVEIKDAYLHLLDECRRKHKHKGRKAKSAKPPPPPKSSTGSMHTTSSMSSSHSAQSERDDKKQSAAPKSHHEDHDRSKHRTKDKAERPPDPPPAKKPSKLSKQPPSHPDRRDHGSTSRSKSHRDDVSDDEDRPHKRHHTTHDHEGEETDFEFVDHVDLGTPLHPLHAPRQHSSADTSRDWVFALPLTLEELYAGGLQRYSVTRTLRDGRTQRVRLNVRVSPGWAHGTPVRMRGAGNERADGSFQDIVFVVQQAPHADYTRAGADLAVTVQVPWRGRRPDSAASDCTEGADEPEDEDHVYVKALNGNEYALPIPHSLAAAAGGSRIVGAGMPVRKHGKVVGKGDLLVKWDFIFTEAEKGQRLRWHDLKKVMHWKH
ncbi:DnaJ-domain-containing protein [Phanerochaete sordida]|uniref:DnaJ-domain-containing protein n=1 Tax=Phanerochaete sordida TaxID=48140 RepID=A0A9P3GGZ2_9APHY|nr:DnaJ-domain-containing protein [Phanerochaete sordida]